MESSFGYKHMLIYIFVGIFCQEEIRPKIWPIFLHNSAQFLAVAGLDVGGICTANLGLRLQPDAAVVRLTLLVGMKQSWPAQVGVYRRWPLGMLLIISSAQLNRSMSSTRL